MKSDGGHWPYAYKATFEANSLPPYSHLPFLHSKLAKLVGFIQRNYFSISFAHCQMCVHKIKLQFTFFFFLILTLQILYLYKTGIMYWGKEIIKFSEMAKMSLLSNSAYCIPTARFQSAKVLKKFNLLYFESKPSFCFVQSPKFKRPIKVKKN